VFSNSKHMTDVARRFGDWGRGHPYGGRLVWRWKPVVSCFPCPLSCLLSFSFGLYKAHWLHGRTKSLIHIVPSPRLYVYMNICVFYLFSSVIISRQCPCVSMWNSRWTRIRGISKTFFRVYSCRFNSREKCGISKGKNKPRGMHA
jgi:hypothetical protein